MFRFAFTSEIAQLVVAVIGTMFAFWSLFDAISDKAIRESDTDGLDPEVIEAKKIVSNGVIYSDLVHLAIKGILIMVGVAGCLLPPPVPDELRFPAALPGVALPAPGQSQESLEAVRLERRAARIDRAEQLAADVTRWGLVVVTFLLMFDSVIGRKQRRDVASKLREASERDAAEKKSRRSPTGGTMVGKAEIALTDAEDTVVSAGHALTEAQGCADRGDARDAKDAKDAQDAQDAKK